jgi:hypothetical protein
MAFTVTSLPNYVEQNRSALITAAVLAAKSARLFTPMPDVKGPTTLNLLDVAVNFQSGEACGFTPSGDDVLSQRTLTPGIIKVNKSCARRCSAPSMPSTSSRLAQAVRSCRGRRKSSARYLPK